MKQNLELDASLQVGWEGHAELERLNRASCVVEHNNNRVRHINCE